MRVDGIIFDKDGTLFDFGSTWNSWAAEMIPRMSEGSTELEKRLAHDLGFNLEAGEFFSIRVV